MRKIVIELTNRCNLRCQHCFSGRHGGKEDLPLPVLSHILQVAGELGFTHLSYTGGDPTVYPHFDQALRMSFEANYHFGLNTNGWNFAEIYPQLLPYRQQLDVITFSLDGATEATHDQLRGKGSYRRVMKAMSICVVKDIPFTINMVISAHNRHELSEMAQLAGRLGCKGLRFGHIMPSPLTTNQGFDLSPWERKIVEAEIHQIKQENPLPIDVGPGYHTTDLFPCAPLQVQEINVSCHGFLTKCCQLSGQENNMIQEDVIGDLNKTNFAEAYRQLIEENTKFHNSKRDRLRQGDFADSDFFPCWYCTLHYKKVDWLKEIENHPWSALMTNN